MKNNILIHRVIFSINRKQIDGEEIHFYLQFKAQVILPMPPRVFNILLVEDDDVDAMQVQRSLDRCNFKHTLFRAHDGEEALIKLNDSKNGSMPRPHFILLDINMPRMNGVEFLESIRKEDSFKTIMVFVLTTSSDEKDKIDAFRFNVAGYILKPISFNHFHESIEKLTEFVEICQFPQ